MSTWRNWAGDQAARPQVVETPADTAEVAAAVGRAADRDQTVRVVGAGHSFNDLVCTDGTLLSLDLLTGITHVDHAAGLVRVGAGTRIHELNRQLDVRGLALANLGDIDVQTIAGAITTGTHGTGRLLGNLATLVEAVELVTADGSVLELTGEDADQLAAARLSLGALGVVTAYTLRVVPSFNLRGVDTAMPFRRVLSSLDELVDGNDHFEFFWFPHTDVALTRTNNRTTESPAPSNKVAAFVKETLVENTVLDAVGRLGRLVPRTVPTLNRTITRLFPAATRVDKSYRIFASTRSVKFTESEWAVPRAECKAVLQELQLLANRFSINMPLEVRFVAADEDAFLSPAYGRETAYIAVHSYRGVPFQDFFERAQEIAIRHGGRPHWGKRHTLGADALAGLYPEWDRFQNVRSKLDPDGRFANDHIRRVLGVR